MRKAKSHHPVFDLSRWKKIFPLKSIESEQRRSPPRRWPDGPERDVQDLRKASVEAIYQPKDLAVVEQIRQRVARHHELGLKQALFEADR